MDSFRESMDSYRIVTTNPDFQKIRFVPTIQILILGFVSFRFVTAVLKYPYRGFVSDNMISKYIRESFRILTNPPNPYESTESLRILTNPLDKNESCPDRKTAIILFIWNQKITPLDNNFRTATASVTQKSIQNFKIPYRLEVINDLSFSKIITKGLSHHLPRVSTFC